jgi:hypothetical protein
VVHNLTQFTPVTMDKELINSNSPHPAARHKNSIFPLCGARDFARSNVIIIFHFLLAGPRLVPAIVRVHLAGRKRKEGARAPECI